MRHDSPLLDSFPQRQDFLLLGCCAVGVRDATGHDAVWHHLVKVFAGKSQLSLGATQINLRLGEGSRLR